MKLLQRSLIISAAVFAAACAGPNPNPGERTADMAWERGDYVRALSVIRPAAERGAPWTQLRLGIAHELGVGMAKDITKALEWYRKVAKHTGIGGWAEGKLVGATGRPGYFNQNSDALIAQHQISGLYLRGDGVKRDLVEAYLWAKNVSEKTSGRSLFYCCEFAGGRYITASAIADRLAQIEGEMTANDKAAAAERRQNWTPQ